MSDRKRKCDMDDLCDLMDKSNFERYVRKSVRLMENEEKKIKKELDELNKKKDFFKKSKLNDIFQDPKIKPLDAVTDNQIHFFLYLCYTFFENILSSEPSPITSDFGEVLGQLKPICDDFQNIAPEYLKTDLNSYSIEKNTNFMVEAYSDYMDYFVHDNLENFARIVGNDLAKYLTDLSKDSSRKTFFAHARYAKYTLKRTLKEHLNNHLKTIDNLIDNFNRATCINVEGGSLKECNRILQKYQ